MDDAFSRFEADLAHVGQPGRGGPPPHLSHGPPPGMHHPMPGGMPPGPPVGYHAHAHGQDMGAPPPYGMPYGAHGAGPSQAQPYYGQPPVLHQAPRPMGTIAAMRAHQGLPVSGDHYDPDHGVPPMPKGMNDKKQQKGGPGTGPDGLPRKGMLREAAGKRWRDPTLDEWPENDFRIFVGDLGNDVNDDALAKAFQKYPSFAKAKIVKDKRTKKTKGFGFISFTDSNDYAKALREMQGKYIGNRPVKLRKSTWDERNPDLPPPKKKQQKQQQKS